MRKKLKSSELGNEIRAAKELFQQSYSYTDFTNRLRQYQEIKELELACREFIDESEYFFSRANKRDVAPAEMVALPTLAWPGGYPIIYMDEHNESYCADCAVDAVATAMYVERIRGYVEEEPNDPVGHECIGCGVRFGMGVEDGE